MRRLNWLLVGLCICLTRQQLQAADPTSWTIGTETVEVKTQEDRRALRIKNGTIVFQIEENAVVRGSKASDDRKTLLLNVSLQRGGLNPTRRIRAYDYAYLLRITQAENGMLSAVKVLPSGSKELGDGYVTDILSLSPDGQTAKLQLSRPDPGGTFTEEELAVDLKLLEGPSEAKPSPTGGVDLRFKQSDLFQVLSVYSHLCGKPVRNVASLQGKGSVTFESKEKLPKEAALKQIESLVKDAGYRISPGEAGEEVMVFQILKVPKSLMQR